MKISIKIDPETLHIIHQLALMENQIRVLNFRNSKKSMQIELFEITAKKMIAYSVNPNGKDKILTLRYHLANELYELIANNIVRGNYGSFEQNKMNMLKDQLHQKLL